MVVVCFYSSRSNQKDLKLLIHTCRVKQRKLYTNSRLGLADQIKRGIHVEYNKHRILKLHSWLALKPVDKLLTRRVGVRYGGSQPLKDMQAPRTASYRPDKYILNYFFSVKSLQETHWTAQSLEEQERQYIMGQLGFPSL